MQKIENKETIGELLKSNKELLRILALNFNDGREIKKFNEVVGFCEQIVQIVGSYPLDREVVFLDCS
ncbi:MAG: hypothetical protein KGQ83_02110, partial [Planctomycetes bacterium]|nr:hypothetical protein [Planctomycetota bacterium]